jgi:hypothetical protein
MSNEQSDDPNAGSDEQSEDQAATSEGQVETGREFSAGGKDFDSLDDLRTAYSELQRGFTQRSQEFSELSKNSEQNQRAINEIRSDPRLVEAIRTYMTAKATQQGVSVPGLNTPEESEEPTEEDHRLARIELQFETQELRRKYPDLSDKDLQGIYKSTSEMCDKWDADVPLEQAYVQWAHQNGKEVPKSKKGNKKDAQRASTTQPVSGGERTRSKFNSKAPGNERRGHIDKLFRENGIDLSGFSS